MTLQVVLTVSVFNPSPHTGGDNAGYLSLGYALLTRGEYVDLHDPDEPAHTKYPPAYPLLLALAMALGARTWVQFKALSALFMSGAVLLAFLWVADRRSLIAATLIAVILSFADSFLWHSHWILSDPQFLFLTLLSIWAFQRSEGEDGLRWVMLGGAAAILAYFTRSAGLPLIVAVLGWMSWHRRWRRLAVFGFAFAVPAFLWWLRARGHADVAYLSEFWLVDPYDPSRGTIGVGDLFQRVSRNIRLYGGTYLVGGIIGVRGGPVAAFSAGVMVFAAGGWLDALKERRSVAELFVPLYLALILVWPSVWSGDRFALPLYPFLLYYAGEGLVPAVTDLGRRWFPVAVVSASMLLFMAPAMAAWYSIYGTVRRCTVLVSEVGTFACYGERTQEFIRTARWSGAYLPEGARILSRKPRLLYVISGMKSRTYPLTDDPGEFMRAADEGEMGFVILDYLDHLGGLYLVPIIQKNTGAFCSVTGFGPIDGVRTLLFGIQPPAARASDAAGLQDEEIVEVDVRVCGSDRLTSQPREVPAQTSPVVPLLASLDP